MKLMGFHRDGAIWIGAVSNGQVTVLCEATDFYATPDRWLTAARAGESEAEILAEAGVIEAPPVWPGARILCVGLNYKAHAAEGGQELPKYPAIFGRWTRSLIADGDPVPALDDRLDWECELAVVVGRKIAGASPAEAKAAILGYAAFNDISARTYQRHTHQWTPGKNMDRSGPMSAIVTTDEAGDPQAGLHIESRLNGEIMQSGTTADMIFPPGEILSYLSQIMTLYPGDVIATGTCEGVGFARKPPVFMKPGDIIEISVETIGTVSNPIVDATRREG